LINHRGCDQADRETLQQLADYLAVVSLAQINPKTNPAEFDSILNLFSNPTCLIPGLTDGPLLPQSDLHVRSGARHAIASTTKSSAGSRIAS
jgi:hypothetical protein